MKKIILVAALAILATLPINLLPQNNSASLKEARRAVLLHTLVPIGAGITAWGGSLFFADIGFKRDRSMLFLAPAFLLGLGGYGAIVYGVIIGPSRGLHYQGLRDRAITGSILRTAGLVAGIYGIGRKNNLAKFGGAILYLGTTLVDFVWLNDPPAGGNSPAKLMLPPISIRF